MYTDYHKDMILFYIHVNKKPCKLLYSNIDEEFALNKRENIVDEQKQTDYFDRIEKTSNSTGT